MRDLLALFSEVRSPIGLQQLQVILAELDVLDAVLKSLRPGAKFKEAYVQSKGMVANQNPEFLELFVKNVGFGKGVEFKDPQLVLNEKCECEVRPGWVFASLWAFTSKLQGGDCGSLRPSL